MGYIKEPEGVNFIVENKGLSDADRLLMNQIIVASKVKKVRKTRISSSKIQPIAKNEKGKMAV